MGIIYSCFFCESSFFPIPPDILLIALAVAIPKRSLYYALVCSAGSVLGGCLGYLIGWQFMVGIGEKIISFYGLTEKVEYIRSLYMQYDALAIGIAGFTPIPYKVFTISAGALSINFSVFVIASLVSRSMRFFLVGWLIYRFGTGIQAFIEKIFQYAGSCIYHSSRCRVCDYQISFVTIQPPIYADHH